MINGVIDSGRGRWWHVWRARTGSRMMTQKLWGGLNNGAGSREVDDGAGSKEIFSGKF
jgi:hypothetical protein